MATILVVDDSRTVRMSLEFLFKKEGYAVVSAEDGKDGLNKLNEMNSKGEKPNLILSDINMPNMGGIEFITEIKKNPVFKFIPVIVLTTESQEYMKEEGRKAGAAGWIVKPYKPEQMMEVVKKFC